MKLPYLLAGSAIALTLVSCSKDLDTYQGEDGIYFDTTYNGGIMLDDTISVAWGMKKSDVTSQVININVKLFGNTADHDRTFDIKVDTEIMPAGSSLPSEPILDADGKTFIPTLNATAGVDFNMPSTSYVIPANAAQVTIPVTVLRNNTLRQGKRAFKISLIENDHFKFLYSRNISTTSPDGTSTSYAADLQRVIVLNENFPIPQWWDYRGKPYFGTWSQAKASLICDVMNIDREEWLKPAALSAGYLKFCGRYMYMYLQENPHYEDDGTLMEMGRSSIY
ncbi:MAG: DUF4843 domain-containing protein [Clostridiales bacterium]|nr:DUF4843 domain-containing protein [Clostridiales bacterium]